MSPTSPDRTISGGTPVSSGADKKYTAVHYWVKYYEEPSEKYGIDGGKISKPMLKVNGEVICNYDRGWDIEPTCEAAELALAILLKSHN